MGAEGVSNFSHSIVHPATRRRLAPLLVAIALSLCSIRCGKESSAPVDSPPAQREGESLDKSKLDFRIAFSAEGDNAVIQQALLSLEERGPDARVAPGLKWIEVESLDVFDHQPEAIEAMKNDPVAYSRHAFGVVIAPANDKHYVLLWDTEEAALRGDDADWELSWIGPDMDAMGNRAVSFRLNEAGGKRMWDITSNHLDQVMVVVVDGKVHMYATIKSGITTAGQITRGKGYTEKELQRVLDLFLKVSPDAGNR